MILSIALLIVSFVVIIIGAELFTNGVEWLGVRLRLSEGAVGSVLAAVGTALPETTIPLVALILYREAESHEIGLGAILGAPFMLATLAFFVTAAAAWIYRGRRTTGQRLRINRAVLSRDLGFFLPLYGVAIGLIAVYCYYVYLNLRETAEGEKKEPLTFDLLRIWLSLLRLRPDRAQYEARRQSLGSPRLRTVSAQVLVALGLIIAGAYKFVGATQEVCMAIGFSPLLFSLIVAPVATELPEKFNSVIWIREGKDTLSLGNITGAMVFQSTFPVTVGIFLTPWHFRSLAAGNAALLSAAIALCSALLVLAMARLNRAQTISSWPFAVGLVGWLAFIGYVLVTRVI